MAASDYSFSEGGGDVDVCVGIMAPADGLELDLVATLSITDGLKAGTSNTFLSSVYDSTLIVLFVPPRSKGCRLLCS